MDNKRKLKIIILCALVFGVIANFASWSFFFLLWMMVWPIILIVLPIYIFIGLFHKPTLRRSLFIVFTLFLSICSTFGIMEIMKQYKKIKAKELINQVEKFKKENGILPATLEQMQIQSDLKGLKYEAFKTPSEYFIISYNVNKTHRQCYSNRGKIWWMKGGFFE